MSTTAEVKARVLDVLSSAGRPLAIVGRTGSGKTTLLRAAATERASTPFWSSAEGLFQDMVQAIREEKYEAFIERVAGDPKPLIVEHLEDLRDRETTRTEVRRLLLRRSRLGGPTILSLTIARGAAEVAWLDGWSDVVELG
jgi:chromosomal replication initiation ATPase DnaA